MRGCCFRHLQYDETNLSLVKSEKFGIAMLGRDLAYRPK